MHEVHRTVGLQEVAPGALAGIGLAGDEQHPKPVAHAVDLHHRGVVARRQLARRLGHRELQHVDAAMRQRDRQFQVAADGHGEAERRAAVDGDLQRHLGARRGRHRALILDPDAQRQRLAENREGRRVLHDQPPVPVALAPGEQHVQRRRHRGQLPGIVQLPVGHQDGARHPADRLLGQRPGQAGGQQRAGIALAVADDHLAQLGAGKRPDRRAQPLQRRLALRRPVGDFLARAPVVDQQDDIVQRHPLFPLEGRIGERRHQRRRSQRPEPPARQPAPEREARKRRRQRRHRPDRPPGQERVEDHRAGHWPSLSSSAGTCTWSDL